MVVRQETGWFDKRNLSANNRVGGNGSVLPKFGPLEYIGSKPSMSLGEAESYFSDVDGEGKLDLVVLDKQMWGFYRRDTDSQPPGWSPFRGFDSLPNVEDDQLKYIDLTGDGIPDILTTKDQAFTYYPSIGARDYGQGFMITQSLNEEDGPQLVMNDPQDGIYLNDMSGDGLTDFVRVRNGEVCYWPNTGYGTFGAKVTMSNSPWLDTPDQFNQRNVYVADIDGSGPSDILYISSEGVDIYLNQGGTPSATANDFLLSLDCTPSRILSLWTFSVGVQPVWYGRLWHLAICKFRCDTSI